MDPPPPAAPTARATDDPTIWNVDDALCALLEPILRTDKLRKKPDRPRRDDRAIVDGRIHLARTGCQWAALPRELGPKATVHERFTEWVKEDKPEQAWAVTLRRTPPRLVWTGHGRRPTDAS